MSNLCDYNSFYVLVRGNIVLIGHNRNQAAFKKCARFIKCITKIGGTTIDDAEYLDLKPMYNLLQYNFNYSDTAGSLWFYFILNINQTLLMLILYKIKVNLNLWTIRLNYWETQLKMEIMEL